MATEIKPTTQLGGELLPLQQEAVDLILAKKRTLIAFEQGGGKTIIALAATHRESLYPMLIVGPKSVKLQWAEMARKWLPGVRVTTLHTQSQPEDMDADVVVANVDILPWVCMALKERRWKHFVVDESYLIKSGDSQRNAWCQHIALQSGHITLLTGTPIENRPIELVEQLRILGWLDAFGGAWRFKMRYCGAQQVNIGWRTVWQFKGASNTRELHEKLKALGFIRCKLADVWKDCPGKRRTVIPVELSNRASYQAAESDLVAFVRMTAANDKKFHAEIAHLTPQEQGLKVAIRQADKAYKAERAEALVRLGTLRRLVGLGKVAAAQEWIKDFLDTTGLKLVVFVYHRDVGDALVKKLKCPSIKGGDTDLARQQAVKDFQADARVIVCSIGAAGKGLDGLQLAAHCVLFIEYPWTSAAIEQAESRLLRYGQERAEVLSYFMTARVPMEDELRSILKEKARIIARVIDGEGEAQAIQATQTALIGMYRKKGN